MQETEMKTIRPAVVLPAGVGARCRSIRLAAGLKQETLAEALGLAQQTVSAWERDQTFMSVQTLFAFCKLTGVSADVVLGLWDAWADRTVRVEVAAPDVEAASAAFGASAGPFGGPGVGRVYDAEDPEDGPYRCPIARCCHNENGDCKTNGVGCYL